MIDIIHIGIIAAVPTLFVALGGIYTERAKVFNIGLEGYLLSAAFAAVCGSYYFSSWVMGVVFAILSSLIVGLFFICMALVFQVNIFITGLLINLLALGGTKFLLRFLFDSRGSFQSSQIQRIPSFSIPILSDLPYIGVLFSNYYVLVYVACIMVALVYFHIFHTPFGLRMRSVGINKSAAESIGLNVFTIQAQSILYCSVLCGLGGSALSLGSVALFTENMSNGRGWIALSSIILAKAQPVHAFFIVLFFGIIDGASFSLQKYSIPSEFSSMLPYIATIVALAFYSKTHKTNNSGYTKEL